MLQISQISFLVITLKGITFSDGEDLMKLLKDLGKENINIQNDELQTPRFEERQDACDEEKKRNHDGRY